MHRFLPVFVALTLVAASLVVAQPKLDSLTILHWNDFHAQNAPFTTGRGEKYKAGGSASLAGYVKAFRQANNHVLVLSAGDEFQGTPISTFTKGASQIELLNFIMPDAMVVGNHEFDYGADSLRKNLARAKFPVLSANIFDSTTNTTFALPFITRTVGGIKAAVIGISPPGLRRLTLEKNLNGLRVLNTDSVVAAAIETLRKTEKPDIYILLSHQGLDSDSAMAEKHPELDLIISGHDHRTVTAPYRYRQAIMAEAGSRGQYIGKIDLAVSEPLDSVMAFAGTLVEMKEGAVQPDPDVKEVIDEFEATVDQRLSEVIGTALVPLRREGRDAYESALGNMECDAFRTIPGREADVAFINSAGLRKNIDSGAIRLRDVWEVNPFGNTVVYFTVDGATLRKMAEWQAGRPSLQVSGLTYAFDPKKERGSRLVSIAVNGAPVDDARRYSIVTNNYVAEHFGDYFGFDPGSIPIDDTGVVDRDIIIDYIKATKEITAQVEGRIRAIAQ